MADLSPRPERAATRQERVAELQRIAREDYDSNVPLRAPNVREPLIGAAADAVRDQLREPSTTSYTPLHDPDDTEVFPAPLERELQTARKYLAEAATANIHDHSAMVRTAVGLEHRLRSLIAAVEASERGERR